MNVEKLKKLRAGLWGQASCNSNVGMVIQLIDILIESSEGASDRTQPVAEVGGGCDVLGSDPRDHRMMVGAPTPADPRDELIRQLLAVLDSECWEDRIVIKQKAKMMGY